MAWTTPRTWTTGELVTASIMNTHVRDNLLYLAGGNRVIVEPAVGSNYTTTSTSFVDVDAAEWTADITLSNSATAVKVTAQFYGANNTNTNYQYFDIARDGTRIANSANGLIGARTDSGILYHTWLVTCVDEGITPGNTHTYTLQWRVDGNTGQIVAGSGDNPLFIVEEVGT